MATIKSYTDLQQSRKLAEFLPLESADMYYFDDNGGDPIFKIRNGIAYYYDNEDFLCCWSLAALISVLPKIHGLKPILDLEENSIQYSGNGFYVVADNPVDACVAMIEKLKELNLW